MVLLYCAYIPIFSLCQDSANHKLTIFAEQGYNNDFDNRENDDLHDCTHFGHLYYIMITPFLFKEICLDLYLNDADITFKFLSAGTNAYMLDGREE